MRTARPPVELADGAARRGLSLLEIVIATVILAASLAILGQLIDQGRLASTRAANELTALSRCQSVMDAAVVEVVSGIAVPDVLLEDDQWTSEVTVEPTENETLTRVIVVTRKLESDGRRTARVELARLVYTPSEVNPLSEGAL